MPGEVIFLQPQCFDQAESIIDPISQATRGVKQFVLGIAVTAQVRGDPTVTLRKFKHDLFPISRRGGVSVKEQHRDAVFRSAEQGMNFQSWGSDYFGSNPWQSRYSRHIKLLF